MKLHAFAVLFLAYRLAVYTILTLNLLYSKSYICSTEVNPVIIEWKVQEIKIEKRSSFLKFPGNAVRRLALHAGCRSTILQLALLLTLLTLPFAACSYESFARQLAKTSQSPIWEASVIL
jgi:hypothetical protein